jgi:plastocyanin
MASLVRALLLIISVLVASAGGAPVRAQDVPEQPVAEEPAVEEPVAATPPSLTVRLHENRFRPARITVTAGSTVVWVNDEEDEAVEHNVISRDYRWASDNFLPGEAYEHIFDTPGVYRYFCDLHGGMTGQVIVE